MKTIKVLWARFRRLWWLLVHMPWGYCALTLWSEDGRILIGATKDKAHVSKVFYSDYPPLIMQKWDSEGQPDLAGLIDKVNAARNSKQ